MLSRRFEVSAHHHPPSRGVSLRAFPPFLLRPPWRTLWHIWRRSGVSALPRCRTANAVACLFWKHKSGLSRSLSLNPSDLCKSVRNRENTGNCCLFHGCPKSGGERTHGVGSVTPDSPVRRARRDAHFGSVSHLDVPHANRGQCGIHQRQDVIAAETTPAPPERSDGGSGVPTGQCPSDDPGWSHAEGSCLESGSTRGRSGVSHACSTGADTPLVASRSLSSTVGRLLRLEPPEPRPLQIKTRYGDSMISAPSGRSTWKRSSRTSVLNSPRTSPIVVVPSSSSWPPTSCM